jgi:uncharacterized spore protein YtfJ
MTDQPTDRTFDPIDNSAARTNEGFAQFTEGLSASTVFGKPEQIGDRLVITAATLERAGGFGFGGGGGQAGGGGGGGGGAAAGRPVAVIEIGPNGAQVKPVLDLTRIGIAVIATLIALRRAIRLS